MTETDYNEEPMEKENESYIRVKADISGDMSVTAGAGAGKTTALKDRYLNIIAGMGASKGRPKVSEITAVTFTRKAAAEMKEKIVHEAVARLNESLSEGDDERVRFYKALKDDLVSADISTLHSLCANILREHPHEAGVDPDFTLLDENVGGILLEDVIVECIQNDLSTQEPKCVRLIHSYGFSGTVKAIKGLFSNPYLTEKVFGEHYPKDEASSPEEEAARLLIKSLIGFYYIVKDRYGSYKSELSSLDYNDLEMIACRVLKRSHNVRCHYQNKIKFLMVDEFQDTNPIQKEIIYLLSRRSKDGGRDEHGFGPLLFVVGDPKQSIYKFRNADVGIFNQVKRDLGEERALYLLNNYRSHSKIVDFINIFFEMYMPESDEDYQTGYQSLFSKRDVPETEDEPKSRVKCIFFDEKVLSGAAKGTGELIKTIPENIATPTAKSAREFEAKLIAREIIDLVGSGRKMVFDDEEKRERAVRYGDIMILFSALTNADIYTKELKKRGIPYNLSSGTAFYNKPWIHDLMNLLKVADNTYDDIAFAGLMRSPFVLISDTALFAISLAEGESFHEKLVNTSKDDAMMNALNGHDTRKIRFSLKMIKDMQMLKTRLRVSEFIDHFIKLTGYAHVLSSRPDGGMILENVKAFIDLAGSVDVNTGFGPKRFIGHVQLLQKLAAKQKIAQSVSDDDKVKIMSIHSSKGLESKIVIVADISRKRVYFRGNILLAAGRPPGVKVKVEGDIRLKEAETFEALKELENRKSLAEYKRLLYVAATRARDYLIFSGYIGFKKSDLKKAASMEAPENWMDAFKSLFEIRYPDEIPKKDSMVGQEIEFITDAGPKKQSVSCSVEFEDDFSLKDAETRDDPFIGEFKDNFRDLKKIEIDEGDQTRPPEDIFTATVKRHKFTYTVTMLNSFRKCRRLFYYKYVYGIPEYGFLPGANEGFDRAGSGLDPAVKGNVVHKVLEDLSDHERGYGQLLERALKEMNLKLTDRQGAEIKGLLDNFISSEIAKRLKSADDVKREVTFITDIDGRKIVAKLDCLYLCGGGWHVLDYKTEKTDDAKGSLEKYRSQLDIYGLCAGLSLGADSITGEVYFLSPDEAVSFNIDVGRVECETRALIKEIESYGLDSFNSTLNECAHCDGCGYASICGKIKKES